ncbi:MAG TPA: DUF1697 domain-containing protein [Spirochaetia bacterium]|nr:DUF1697 domain-containing protein [Spirochaetia bacterium]
MSNYAVLLRGINVGGKNRVPMVALRESLESLGFANVSTYIASGNVILDSDMEAEEIRTRIEQTLPERFELDSELVRVLVLTRVRLQAVIDNRPEGFGEQSDRFHSDAIFLLDMDSSAAIRLFNPREGVDNLWAGDGVIYSQRLSVQRTRSRLSRIMATPEYQSMTIRSWSTTTKILEMLNLQK